MINTNNKYFMMIEPKLAVIEQEVNDEITQQVEEIMKTVKEIAWTKGLHFCNCGVHSGNAILEVTINGKQYETNSLALHYIKYHRSEVPQSEIDKIFK